jgi:LacI family transcriptional regulator
MSNLSNKIRIVDIAKLAGVSHGTVDRVLHNRGGVAEEHREKILSIIEELHYQPNILARSLAMKKTFHFVSLLPGFKRGEYWEIPAKGIDRAHAELQSYNVDIEKLYFDQFDSKSFTAAASLLLQMKPDAALIVPTFRNEAVTLMEQLYQKGIAGVYIDSNTEDNHHLSYFGQHSYQSGYTAACLLEGGLPDNAEILVVKTMRIAGISNQTQRREEGFMAYFNENGHMDKYHFIHTRLSADDDAGNLTEIKNIFNKRPNIRAAIVFNSRVHQLAHILKKLAVKDVKLIGYDLSGNNVSWLKNGMISILIAQRPEDQGYQGIMALFNHVVLNKKIKRVNYMPIDILTRENIDYYTNYN